jgi:hypothetical protein
MRSIPFVFLVACAADGLCIPAAAQNSLGVGPVMGASFERFENISQGPVAFTFRRSRLTGGGPAEDLAVRLFPEALSERVALIGVDAGVREVLARGPVGLLVKGGVSPLVRLGPGQFDLIPGLEAGVGTLIRVQRRAALRIDLTHHTFFSDGEHYNIWSFGVGLVALPPAGGNRPR